MCANSWFLVVTWNQRLLPSCSFSALSLHLNTTLWCYEILLVHSNPHFNYASTAINPVRKCQDDEAVLHFLTWPRGPGTELVGYWNIQSLAIYKHLLSIEGELLLANCCRAPTDTFTNGTCENSTQ